MALKAFQDRGITDRYALAALMGNVKQESKFIANICEGGARVPYEQCRIEVGMDSFNGLPWVDTMDWEGMPEQTKCNPSTTECQLGYLFTEYQWKIESNLT